ncbi:tRNA nucleotidyltransferase (CCA-adding enzyme) [[Clostridium] fimetarium]|uniref:tRNA nucleotidyltransferase (CCA-adding enzyme) n=2 Tax=[Clostridium] fimetarium TaxID=99656 RepID=A0A1I0P039_9FIRM|nr:tRNA nucleotidyltransferase (CCA-adding enzyme) [[Clostridium] fimetarium]
MCAYVAENQQNQWYIGVRLIRMKKENIYVDLPENVVNIISKLESDGNQAYAVGGCVRDSVLKRTPEDWDITTSAVPQQVKALFKRTVDTGIKHGTVTIMIDKSGYEVTTYRIDGDYEDGRHPKSVEFSVCLEDDLKRRDFTINAMAYNNATGLVDQFNGIDDLNSKIIRCVGNPTDRFSEDALRMMRAIRFSAQLGFSIEDQTYAAIKELAVNINKVSRERIHVELNKTLLSDHPDYIMMMYETRLTKQILPIIDVVLSGRRSVVTLTMLKISPKELVLKYAALLNDIPADKVTETLKDLKLDNNTIYTVTKLVECSKLVIQEKEPSVREAIYKYGKDIIPLIILHQETILKAKEISTGIKMTGGKNHIAVLKRLYQEIMDRGDCISVKDLNVNGSDLMEYGLKGPIIGETLDELLHIVMENPKLNEKETLIAMIENR